MRAPVAAIARLRMFGSEAAVARYPGIGHIDIILFLVSGFRWLTPLRQDITALIQHP